MNILTFDIEDWFHTHENRKFLSGHIWKDLPARVDANTDRILDMLDELELKATFFVLGWVAEHHPKLVERIYSKGHEIASHSHWHHNARLLSSKDFEKDLVRCLKQLQEITGSAIITYRAPGYSLKLKDKWAFEILAVHGIKVDSSVQMQATKQSLPLIINAGDNQILEFPLIKTVYGFPYSGGGYFRAMPKVMLNHFFKGDKDRLLYFHPRDFDPDNPKTNMFSAFRNMLNLYNTEKCMTRLKDILETQPSCTMGQAAKKYQLHV